MVDPKRYVIHYDARGEQEHPKGDFVHWHDYQALSSHLAEMRAEVERITFNRDMFASREASALAERDCLAAENERMREALSVADQFFAGITPDANTQSPEEMDETRSAIAEAVRTALASLEDRA